MKKVLAILLSLAMLLGMAACGSSQSQQPATETVTPVDLIIGTGATSGTYYFVGAALGNVVAQQSEKLNVMVQSTSGGVENIKLVGDGSIDIGMCNTDGLFNAYNGKVQFDGNPQDVRLLMALYPSITHLITKKGSGITSWKDLKGKKVCMGTQGSSFVAVCAEILKEYGIDWEKDITPYYLTAEEMGTAVNDGDIDAGFIYGGAPLAGITNACVSGEIEFVSMDKDVIDKLCDKYPYYTPAVLRGDVYPGEHADTDGFALYTCMFCSADMDEEIAYEFVKTAMENLDLYKDTNASTQNISSKTVWDGSIPLHSGAERYYKEMGWM